MLSAIVIWGCFQRTQYFNSGNAFSQVKEVCFYFLRLLLYYN